MKTQFLKLTTIFLTVAAMIIVCGFGRLEVIAAESSTQMMDQDGHDVLYEDQEKIRDFLLCLGQFNNKAVYAYEYNCGIGGNIEGNAAICYLKAPMDKMSITDSSESAISANKGETIVSHFEGDYLELANKNSSHTIGNDVKLSGNIPDDLKVLNPEETQQSLCDISGVYLFNAAAMSDKLFNYAYKPSGDPLDAVDNLLSTGIAKENDIISVQIPASYLLGSTTQHNFMRKLYEHNKGTTIIVNVIHDETIDDMYIQDAEMKNFNTMKYTSDISVPDESIPYVIWNFGDYIKNIHIMSEFGGIIMAPNAVVQLGESGFFRGQIIAREIDSNFTITQVTDPRKQRIIGKLNDSLPHEDPSTDVTVKTKPVIKKVSATGSDKRGYEKISLRLSAKNGINYYKFNSTKIKGNGKKTIDLKNITYKYKNAKVGTNKLYVYDKSGGKASLTFKLVKPQLKKPVITIRKGSKYTVKGKKTNHYKKVSFTFEGKKLYKYSLNGKVKKLGKPVSKYNLNYISRRSSKAKKGKNTLYVYDKSLKKGTTYVFYLD